MSKPTLIQELDGAVFWKAGMAIDADGSPRAYAPLDSGLEGLDALCEAGRPGRWWAIMTGGDGKPVRQVEGDPAPGYYVSTTALVDRARPLRDPRRYVDAERVPYVAIPPELRDRGLRLGDVAMVSHAGKRCAAIVADIGPEGHYGEGSIALAVALGIPSSPRHGGCEAGVAYAVWLRSSRGWPRLLEDIASQAEGLLASWAPRAWLLGTG